MYVDHDGHMQLLVIALIDGVISAGTNIILSLVGQSTISHLLKMKFDQFGTVKVPKVTIISVAIRTVSMRFLMV